MAEHEARRPGAGVAVRGRVFGALATVASWVGLVIAAILVVHVLLTVGGANPDNGITRFVKTWADVFALGFRDLFTPGDGKLRVLVNYGIAALFWLVARAIAVRLLRRLA